MKTKTISLAVISLGVCTLAMAAEYKAPTVGFKEAAPSHKATEMMEFNDEYKVEGAVKTDRQIASEKDPSEREPSSLIAMKKKKVEQETVGEEKKEDDKMTPTPWLYNKNKQDGY